MNYHAETEKELVSAIEEIGIINLSIIDIDTPGVIGGFTPKKKRSAERKYGIATDWAILLKLSDDRTLSIYASSCEDTYEGFSITINPKPFEYERDNDFDVRGYFKECLKKKITGYEIIKYGNDDTYGAKNINSETPKYLVIKLEDGTKITFSHSLFDEYMNFGLELPKE